MTPRNLRSREALVDWIEAGGVADYTFFWGHGASPADGIGKNCLSQWYGSEFEIDGVRYATAEHYMMAEKARLFADTESVRAILAAPHPADAKRLGRSVRNFAESTWCEHRMRIVVRGNLAKFGQHAALLEFLRGTQDQVLVEASPADRVWGIGLDAGHPHAREPKQWRGLNLLGFALMEVRSALA
ncbi:MAG TPA: NADAR family protein [Polyangiaceae bacterium]|nr:NADAR family protein [Polyangiaceae bacterium]